MERTLLLRRALASDAPAVGNIYARSWQDGYRGLFLWVLAENHRALRFYEAMGLTATGKTREISVAGASVAEAQYALRWR